MKTLLLLLLLSLPTVCWGDMKSVPLQLQPIIATSTDSILEEDIIIKPPLPIKIDTLSVDTDTVGFEQVEKRIHSIDREFMGGFDQCDLTFYGWGQSSECAKKSHYKTAQIWEPVIIVTYITDTTYRLTPEQVWLLEYIKINDSIPWGPGLRSLRAWQTWDRYLNNTCGTLHFYHRGACK